MANITRRRGWEPASQYVDPFSIMRSLLGWENQRDRNEEAPTAGTSSWLPSFEVLERKDSYVFRADVPGVKEDDLDIQLIENRLTVSGKRDAEQRNEGETFYAYERSYGTFQRVFTLPEGVDAEHVRAEMKDGVLTLVVPKKPEVQPKKISIKPTTAANKQQ